MKFVISLLILNSTLAIASPIKIFHESTNQNALLVKEIFHRTYQIPEDLISISEIASCDALSDKGKLDLCIKKNGDLEVVSVNKRFIHESLKIFNSP